MELHIDIDETDSERESQRKVYPNNVYSEETNPQPHICVINELIYSSFNGCMRGLFQEKSDFGDV